MKNNSYLLIVILIICGTSQIMCAQSKSRKNPKTPSQTNSQLKYDCLPKDIKLDQIVSVTQKTSGLKDEVERETVKQRLDKLDARCRAGKLVDGKNREIRFYQLEGCWGNPPDDYLEILDRQKKELEELKKKYTVIEITCNPSGEMPY
ncbi:MAG: hypothetical protein M3209_11665 [Acidobacteriota bacterium]|nr:hypothetical protein [Acidobacteriota bacterium]